MALPIRLKLEFTKTLIICYRIEESITLHHSNFAILGKQAKEFHPEDGPFKLSHRLGSPVPVIPGYIAERTSSM